MWFYLIRNILPSSLRQPKKNAWYQKCFFLFLKKLEGILKCLLNIAYEESLKLQQICYFLIMSWDIVCSLYIHTHHKMKQCESSSFKTGHLQNLPKISYCCSILFRSGHIYNSVTEVTIYILIPFYY